MYNANTIKKENLGFEASSLTMDILAESNNPKSKPFLRWAGGKRKIVNELIKYLPNEPVRMYWEPFLGSGALFFALSPDKAFLSDKNVALINCYKHVRDHPEIMYGYVREHLKNTSKEYYYRIRNQYNVVRSSIAQSARFIYLNRTSFNGIYRVNTKGKYNVPYGYREPPPPLQKDDLVTASLLLKRTSLEALSFENITSILDMREAEAGSFVYFDPPYPSLVVGKESFNHYTDSRFSWREHEKLAVMANKLNQCGYKIMISYSDIDIIRSLYSNWNIFPLSVKRYISANGVRMNVTELVITNYSVTF